MKVGIMQPYFLPYIGYFQLINAVDKFVIYDNIEYTKKGWINRNRILINGKSEYITLPLKKDSDFLYVNQRFLSDTFDNEKNKILRKIKENYRNSPNFDIGYCLCEKIFNYKSNNLFEYIFNSLQIICNYLNIKTELILSSTINIDHNLKSEEKVLSICAFLKADIYINSIGGMSIYNLKNFEDSNLKLEFINSQFISYQQRQNLFIPWLSILDVIMFNPLETIRDYLLKTKTL